jgi:hemerythrin-like domain-containing protein
MSRTQGTESPIAGDLIRVHTVISRSLETGIERVNALTPASLRDRGIHSGLIKYLRAFMSTMHAHHLTEDDLMFPMFKPGLSDAPYETLSEQHKEMVSLLVQLRGDLLGIRRMNEPQASLDGLKAWMMKMRDLWTPHKEVEEAHFTSESVNASFSIREQRRATRRFMVHGGWHSRPVSLSLPLFVYSLTPEERTAAEKSMLPPPVTRVLVPFLWKWNWKAMIPFLTYPPEA